MKLLFLDIDGVLNSSGSVIAKVGPKSGDREVEPLWLMAREDCEDRPGYFSLFTAETIDPVAVGLVNRLLEGEDIMLVLSSSHRKDFWNSVVPYGSPKHLARLRTYLGVLGVKVPRLFDVTPVLNKKRGDEIDQWLTENATRIGFDGDVDGWAILDDAADMLPYQPLIRCDATVGFTFDKYVEACKALRLNEPGLILL